MGVLREAHLFFVVFHRIRKDVWRCFVIRAALKNPTRERVNFYGDKDE